MIFMHAVKMAEDSDGPASATTAGSHVVKGIVWTENSIIFNTSCS
jgi:hypothetical protein